MLFGELVARRSARGLGVVPNRGGWWFGLDEIAAAEERLKSAVAVLPADVGRSSRVDSPGVATDAPAGGVVSTLAIVAAARR